jgi:hypothetical protein
MTILIGMHVLVIDVDLVFDHKFKITYANGVGCIPLKLSSLK